MAQSQLTQQIGKRLRELRERAGLTQAQLGQLARIEPPEISKYESGKRLPKLDTLERFADGLGVHLRDFLPEKDTTEEWWEEAIAMRLRGLDAETQQHAIDLIDVALKRHKRQEPS